MGAYVVRSGELITMHYTEEEKELTDEIILKNYLMSHDGKVLNRDAIVLEIVHELRNPLTAIKIANDLLRQEQAEGNGHGDDAMIFTEIIKNNIQRLDNM